MPTTFVPLHDYVLIQRAPLAQTVRTSALIIPDSAQPLSQQGTVIAVGPGLRDAQGLRKSLTVVPGNHVVFGELSGIDHIIDGQPFVILHESEILCVLNDH